MPRQSNSSLKPRRLCLNQTWIKQKGAALIFIAFILGLGAAVYVLKTYNADAARAKQDEKTYKALNDAKTALIAWAVNYKNAPGQMPWPDRKEAVSPNYDGSSDCVATTFIPSYLLGQLPSLPTTSPCIDPNTGSVSYSGLSTYPGLGQEFRDAQGNRLWYAVSRNLVHDYEHAEDPIINPGMINAPHAITPYLRQSGTQSYPWLRVLDRNGNLVSDRVAAVLIAPGDPIGGQNRSGIADPDQFLDSFNIGAASYKNSDYSLVNEDFIMGEDSRSVPSTDTNYVKPYYFNDKLVYITIDELMAALEKRVGEQVRSSLRTYKNANGYYPYAAQLGSSLDFSGEQDATGLSGLNSGLVPVNYQSCSYATIDSTHSSMSCIQPIFDVDASNITQVRFYGSTSFRSSSASCSISSGNRCYCSGTGSCSDAVGAVAAKITFTCNTTSCSAVGVGASGDIRVRGGKLTYRSGGCVHTTFPTKDALGCSDTTTSRITCNTTNGSLASNGDARFDSFLPAWINYNKWGGYIYYQMTRPANVVGLSVGNKTSGAIIITIGNPIISTPFASKGSAQVRTNASTQCNQLNEYLDSDENVDTATDLLTGNPVFEPTSKLRSGNYNDQTFVVLP